MADERGCLKHGWTNTIFINEEHSGNMTTLYSTFNVYRYNYLIVAFILPVFHFREINDLISQTNHYKKGKYSLSITEPHVKCSTDSLLFRKVHVSSIWNEKLAGRRTKITPCTQ